MKKILVPTDFSDNAWDALTYAIRLYNDIPCQFFILNTFEVNPSRIPSTMQQFAQRKVYDVLSKESEKELSVITNYLNDNMLNDKHQYRTISASGSLVDIIENIVEKEDIDIIIMGTTGASGLKGIFMGSNAVKVIKEINDCSIISVPEKYVYEEPEQVIFATDYKKQLREQELKCLIELQLIHSFKIQFTYIKKETKLSELQENNINILKSYFNKELTSFEEIESDTALSKAITIFAEKQKANMICLVKYEHSFIEKLTHEPVIKKVGFHTSVPLLILPV